MRIITDLAQKIKLWVEDMCEWFLIYEKFIYQSLLLLIMTSLAFGLGRYSQISTQDTPFYLSQQAFPVNFGQEIEDKPRENTSLAISAQAPLGNTSNTKGGQIIASKNSTKYHLPWCSGAKSIKPENRVYFTSEAEAIASGRSKAGNCK